MTLCGTAQPEDDRRDPGAEVDETVAVAPGAGSHAPGKVGRVQDLGVERDLDALVADLTQVLEPRGAHAQRRRQPSRDEGVPRRSEEHTSELQSLTNLVCRLLL